MKTWFQQLPIRHKLNTIILLACSVALLLTTAVYFVSQWYLVRKQLRGELQTLSSVIAENSSDKGQMRTNGVKDKWGQSKIKWKNIFQITLCPLLIHYV